MSTINRIRQKIIDRAYYLSSHAEDEMVDDNLERADIENAILTGEVDKRLTADVRELATELLETPWMVGYSMLFVVSKKLGS